MLKHIIGATYVAVFASAVCFLLGQLGIDPPTGHVLCVIVAAVGIVVSVLVLCGIIVFPG